MNTDLDQKILELLEKQQNNSRRIAESINILTFVFFIFLVVSTIGTITWGMHLGILPRIF